MRVLDRLPDSELMAIASLGGLAMCVYGASTHDGIMTIVGVVTFGWVFHIAETIRAIELEERDDR